MSMWPEVEPEDDQVMKQFEAEEQMGKGIPSVMIGERERRFGGAKYYVSFRPSTNGQWQYVDDAHSPEQAREIVENFIDYYEDDPRTAKRQATKKAYEYVPSWTDADADDEYFIFAGMPPSVARDLMNGWPNIEPLGRQNDSPTHGRLVELAEKHDGLVGGYVINASYRDDNRISIDKIFIPDKGIAESIAGKHAPDEFEEAEINGKQYYRLWWD